MLMANWLAGYIFGGRSILVVFLWEVIYYELEQESEAVSDQSDPRNEQNHNF